MKDKIKVLISESELQKRIDELGAQINKDYEGREIILVCVLKGSVLFMVDLAKRLQPDSIEFEFLEVSSYGNEEVSSGIIKINKDLGIPITGKNVLLVEDIVDTGATLSAILKHLKAQKPASLKLCTLLDKPERRIKDGIDIDYTGFTIPNKFVLGYGLDYQQKYRNLRYIGVVDTDNYRK